MRELLRKVLEKDGHTVTTASGSCEALALLAACLYDLVVTDLLMPFDGGLALLEAIRRTSPATPVIIVTAFGDWKSYAQAMELGASAFISKPLRMAELTGAVHTAMMGRKAAASP